MTKKEMKTVFKFIKENMEDIQLSTFSPVIAAGLDTNGWEINEPSGVAVFTFVYVKQPLKVKIKISDLPEQMNVNENDEIEIND